VLLAEDNPINQVVTVEMLEKQGHKVFVAANGKEALALLERESVDVLLLDVQMPEMSGFEVATAIRDRERDGSQHLPIIALTARAMKGDRDRCLAAGMDDYLSKPLTSNELELVIERLTGSRRTLTTQNPRLRAKMAHIFLDIYSQWLAKIREALTQGDAHAVGETAHTLKGSVSHFDDPAAATAVRAALRLEQMGQANTLAGADEVFAELEETLRQLHPVLVRWSEPVASTSADQP
jgi:CheY-like chemotaxis protein